MSCGWRSGIVGTVIVTSTMVTAQVGGQTPANPPSSATPRTAWGDLDIQGTWTSDNMINVPFERPVALDLATIPTCQIYEYACHEGNYGLANILSAARAEEKAGIN